MSAGLVLLIALIPAGVMVAGAVAGTVFTTGALVRSAVQHLAAGLVLAAVAVELVPALDIAGHALAVLVGFAAGVVLTFGLAAALKERGDDAGGAGETGGAASLLAAVGVDALIDGLLLGLALAATGAAAQVLVVALGMELFFLALASLATLRRRGIASGRAFLMVAATGVSVPLGAVLGAVAISAVPAGAEIGVLAFGVAALLYLVVEELLADVHREECVPHAALLFFVGFLGVLVVKALAGG